MVDHSSSRARDAPVGSTWLPAVIPHSHRANRFPPSGCFVNKKATAQPWKGRSDTGLNPVSAPAFEQHRELQSNTVSLTSFSASSYSGLTTARGSRAELAVALLTDLHNAEATS